MKRLPLDYTLCPVPSSEQDTASAPGQPKPPPKLVPLGTHGLLKIVFDTPPQGGFRLGAMRERFKLEDKILAAVEDHADFVDLEEAEVAVLRQAWENHVWPARSRDLLKCEDTIQGLKDPPKPKKEAAADAPAESATEAPAEPTADA